MARPWFLALLLVPACSNADFETPAVAEDASTDTNTVVPMDDTGVVVVDTSALPDVPADAPPAETCPANECGGCGSLANPPETVCGLCKTSKFVCASPTTTKCDNPDDRTEDSDVYFKGYDGTGVTINGALEPAAISFKTVRAGSPTRLEIALQRYDVDLSAEAGNLQVRLIKGVPTVAVDPGAVLATSLIAATLVPDTPSIVPVILPAGLGPFPAGTPLWIEVTDKSPRANFAINGSTATGPADLDFHYVMSGSYVKLTGKDPYLVVRSKACF